MKIWIVMMGLLTLSYTNCSPGFSAAKVAGASTLANSDLPTSAPKTKDPFFGVHEDFFYQNTGPTDLAKLIQQLDDLGVGTLRMPIRWVVLQNATDSCDVAALTPNSTNIAAVRALLDQIPKDIEIIAYLDSPPPSCRALFTTSPAAFSASYASFVKLAVSTFKDRVHIWEIWNEPNNNNFYLTPPNGVLFQASDYVNFILKPGYAAIKAADPAAIATGGTLVYNGVEGHTDRPPQPYKPYGEVDSILFYFIPNFLAEMVRAVQLTVPDATRAFDALTTHPYYYHSHLEDFTNYDPYDQTYGPTGTTNALITNGVTKMPIYWTEFNVTVAQIGTESQQADLLETMYTNALKGRDDPNFPLKAACWFNLRDTSGTTNGPGLINVSTGAPREAYTRYQAFIKAHQRLN